MVDYALCGAGLQNCLLVAALRDISPKRSFTLLEAETVAGNHTWCFYGSDLSERARAFVRPMVTHQWPRYEVRFPDYFRVMETSYSMMASGDVAPHVERIASQAPGRLEVGTAVGHAEAERVTLEDGTTREAAVVVDARGARKPAVRCGYQKFYGEEVTLAEDHDILHPIVMDATVPQVDGYRFMYVLPLGSRHLLVEDTSFSSTADLDDDNRRAGIRDWLTRQRRSIRHVLRTERGVLPMPIERDSERQAERGNAPESQGAIEGGYRGGWFHPGTGYSVALAAQLAELVAGTATDVVAAVVARAARERERAAGFYRLLNRMLFDHYRPEDRRSIFERFYRMPASLIERFCAMACTPGDKTRLLLGKPPRGFHLRRPAAQSLAASHPGKAA